MICLTDLSPLFPEPDSEKVDDFQDWGERGSSEEGDDASCHTKHLENTNERIAGLQDCWIAGVLLHRIPQSRKASDKCSADCWPGPSKPPTRLSLSHTQGRSPVQFHESKEINVWFLRNCCGSDDDATFNQIKSRRPHHIKSDINTNWQVFNSCQYPLKPNQPDECGF